MCRRRNFERRNKITIYKCVANISVQSLIGVEMEFGTNIASTKEIGLSEI